MAILERLAANDVFRSIGLDRRQALWAVRGLASDGNVQLPLFTAADERSTGPDVEMQLPAMRTSEHVVNDYQTHRLSLKAHPVSFLRAKYRKQGMIKARHLLDMRQKQRCGIAGVVLVRQRPGTAKGVVFMTIEDETGVANIVIWKKVMELFRKTVRRSACMPRSPAARASARPGRPRQSAASGRVDKCADYWSSICIWHSSREIVAHTFGRQAIPMTWDYAEANPFSSSSGNWTAMRDWVWKVVSAFMPTAEGTETQQDAQTLVYPRNAVISTDPPYYDNIGYADLSDFFFCWMKPLVRPVFPEAFGVLATPKSEELVATPYRHGGKQEAETFFLKGMRKAIANMARQSATDYSATIYYAFKQSEIAREGISSTGWATFLQAVIEAGYAVVGTWPMRTEMANRMIASGTNALANSVILVCRKREATADTITRAEFIRALKRELPPAIAELQAANLSPADMPQSAIGPGMGVFSRCEAVLEADDSPMSVRTALQLINAELDDYLGGIQGEFDPDTRFAISWFEQNGMGKGDYGVADNLARARGIAVESVRHAGIVESQAGKVRILKRDELDPDWEPQTDSHLTVWECLQHLVHSYEQDGVSYNTALLLRKIDDRAGAVKDLAYCLYDICASKRQDAKEATAYNALIADWPDLTREAAAIHDTRGPGQTRMDL